MTIFMVVIDLSADCTAYFSGCCFITHVILFLNVLCILISKESDIIWNLMKGMHLCC